MAPPAALKSGQTIIGLTSPRQSCLRRRLIQGSCPSSHEALTITPGLAPDTALLG
jgi:hypothetical protein